MGRRGMVCPRYGYGGAVYALAASGINVYAGGPFTSAGGVSGRRLNRPFGAVPFGDAARANPACIVEITAGIEVVARDRQRTDGVAHSRTKISKGVPVTAV